MSDGRHPGETHVNIREETETMAARIREELARRRLSRSALAASARISLSTLEKALSGRRPFTLATLVRLEEALGLSLRPGEPAEKIAAKPNGNGSAPDELGSYARAAVAWLEGSYLTLRPSVSDRGALYAYRTDIAWDDASSTLMFREAERLDASSRNSATSPCPTSPATSISPPTGTASIASPSSRARPSRATCTAS